jgi:solute carrier family 35 protein E1
MAFLLMIPIWVYTDLRTQLQPKPTPPNPITGTYLFGLFLLNGSVHFSQCILAFSILARSSPVAYSIASLIKRVAVICLAIVWFGQSIGLVQAFGMTMTFAGLWMYNKAKTDIEKGERKRVAAEKRSTMLLPQTTADVRLLAEKDYATPDLSPSNTPLPPNLSPYQTPHRAQTPPLLSKPASGRNQPMMWSPSQLDARLGSEAAQTSRNRGEAHQLAADN